MSSDHKDSNSDLSTETKLRDEWLIRDCDVYDEEYSDCRSMKARFHQYFVHGKTQDCTQWKRDANNCYRWRDQKDIKAAAELIESEKARRKARLEAHYNNRVWSRRTEPPTDWIKPLPAWMQEEYQNTYLDIKNREMRGEIEPVIDSKCSIM